MTHEINTTAIKEIQLMDVQSPKYDDYVEKHGEYHDTCFLCGKRIKDGRELLVHYTSNGTLVNVFSDELEISQGCFPVGRDCAKKLPADFTMDPHKK